MQLESCIFTDYGYKYTVIRKLVTDGRAPGLNLIKLIGTFIGA
jgi:hypothetical protein